MWYIWLILAGIFFIAEIMTVGFLIFWLGIGALFTMLVSFFTDNIIIQTTIFVISSTLLIILTKPFVNKFLSKGSAITTNAFSIVGKKAVVTKDINPTLGLGQIKVNGDTWSAKCDEERIIPKDSEVEVLRIDGVKAVVSIISKSEPNIDLNEEILK